MPDAVHLEFSQKPIVRDVLDRQLPEKIGASLVQVNPEFKTHDPIPAANKPLVITNYENPVVAMAKKKTEEDAKEVEAIPHESSDEPVNLVGRAIENFSRETPIFTSDSIKIKDVVAQREALKAERKAALKNVKNGDDGVRLISNPLDWFYDTDKAPEPITAVVSEPSSQVNNENIVQFPVQGTERLKAA